jgi:Na+/H+-dicarboxylate symporter
MRFSLPLQLLLVLLFVVFFGQYFSVKTISCFYTFSMIFKEFLNVLLPGIVFSFIASGIISFKKNAPLVLLVVLVSIICSNIAASLVSYFIGINTIPFLAKGVSLVNSTRSESIFSLLNFSIPQLVSVEKAMLASIFFGIVISYVSYSWPKNFINGFKNAMEFILMKFFIPILPLYVFGFLLKLSHEGAFRILSKSFGMIFVLLFISQILYGFLAYLFVAKGKLITWWRYYKNSLPSYLAAFSTMSSTAAIPVTINSAIKNTGNKPLARMCTPIMANVHLLGDAFTTPLLALSSMFLFFGYMPNFGTYFYFVLCFCMVMLATSGVPGGGIIVVIPLLKSIFGFTPEMIGIVTTIYLLQDSFGTASNVMGDGALIIFVNKVLKKLNIAS